MKKADNPQRSGARNAATGYGFGAFKGVYTPSILTIIGVVMYLRFGWMLGNLGLTKSLLMVTGGTVITFLTGLSISSLATNMRMKGGGAYYMLSRSFGAEAGAAMGIPLALSQAIAVSFYVAGFAEALTQSGIPWVAGWNPRFVGLATLAVLSVVSTLSADIALKSQYAIMAAIAFSLVSFFLGGKPEGLAAPDAVPPIEGFWPVFAVFFPAVTGILSGVGMSGDLRDPGRAIPRGTLAAILTGYAVYMAVPIALHAFVPDADILRSDSMILQKCARWAFPILLGVWAATLSSAIGSFLCAPRVFQALSRDRLLPSLFGRGFGRTDDPRISAAICFGIAAAGLWFGNINAIAPILTMFNLSTYALLNLSAGMESVMGNPSWRPTFRVRAFFPLAGFALCVGAMFMISPGWTFAALGCEALIYWIASRRVLRARWGDMRTGLLVQLAHFALRRLARRGSDVHTWRPNLLVLSGAPERRPRLVELAAQIAGRGGLPTYAAVIPESAWTAEHGKELSRTFSDWLDHRGIDALVRIQPAPDTAAGLRALVQVYGYGPLEPNTVLLGGTARPDAAEALKLALACRKNVVIVPEVEEDADPGSGNGAVDVWWRGGNDNAPFMLALACLLQRNAVGPRLRLRLCHMLANGESAETERQRLEGFLNRARVKAEIVILSFDGRTPFHRIAETSADSTLALMGLRKPEEGESSEAYADYLATIQRGTASLPRTAFACAAEAIDFNDIFEA